MAAIVPKALQISNPFPSTLKKTNKPSPPLLLPLPPHALDDSKPDPDPDSTTSQPSDSNFDDRLAQVRLKYRSGTGKKAEQRRAKKSQPGAARKKGGAGAGGVMLPPVPLREPVSAGGVRVDFGFSPYSERLNGRLAGLGLAALILVELGSGKGLLSYHLPPILFIQIYTVAAVSAVFIKYEKERLSVWPEKPSSSSSAVAGD